MSGQNDKDSEVMSNTANYPTVGQNRKGTIKPREGSKDLDRVHYKCKK